MAEFVNRIASQTIFKYRSINALRNFPALSSIPISRSYSQYPKSIREPIIPRDDKKTVLESEAFKEIELLPVRAALNYYSSSMFLDPRVMKFTNYVMEGGNKIVARRIIGETFTQIKRIQVGKWNRAKPENRENIVLDPYKIFNDAINNAIPYLRIIKIRHGQTWYQVPKSLTPKMAETRSMKWFVEIGNDKHRKERFFKTLAIDLIEASENRGRVIAKKIELHKLCEANKAYAHFRWG